MTQLRVLVVDDEEEFVSALVERLSFRDIDATGETDGKRAIERVRENGFDVILLDIKMPGTDGLQALREILSAKPDTIVFLITGYGSTDLGDEGIEAGAYDYLPKPIKIDKLVEQMQQAVARREE